MKKKRRLKFKNIIILGLFIGLGFYFYKNYIEINYPSYEVIKEDTSNDYEGIGKEKTKNEDGYTSTFTTNSPYKKTYIEYKQNGNASWSNNTYWGGVMKDTGCGITSLAIVLSGYGFDFTPEDLRKRYYPVMDYNTLGDELSLTYGINNSDFYYDSLHLSNEMILEHLKSNRPIIVCLSSNLGKNRWTTTSHYMVLLASNNNKVYVSNPNGLEDTSKSSGWYDIDEITPYLVKALYVEDYD